MRLYLHIFAFVAIAYAAVFGVLGSGHFTEWPHLEYFRWASCGVFGFLALLSLFLNFRWGKIESQRRKDREELSDLIMILKEGRKHQLAVLDSLKVKAEIETMNDPEEVQEEA